MEENVQLAILYDTYGELLSEHRRQIFEAVRFDDLSLGEIAEEFDISRQAAHDAYRRTVRKLEQYEAALHLVERDLRVKKKVEAIAKLTEDGQDKDEAERLLEIRKLAVEILEDM